MRKISGFVFFVISLIQQLTTFARISIFQKRFRVIKLFAEYPTFNKSKTVLFVITHVVTDALQLNTTQSLERVQRLKECIDGIMKSFSHSNYKIVINTIPHMHLVSFLPEYQKKNIHIHYEDEPEPMFLEYHVFDIFKNFVNDFDYFIFLEDDIIIYDSTFLEKISFFNQGSGDNAFILNPHRYEMYEGKKFYVDQEIFIEGKMQKYGINKLSNFCIGTVNFAEFENSHAGLFCMTHQQLNLWINSGYTWRDKVVAFGTLESAATFCLYENFKIFKPGVSNLNFFEVQHWGTKYSSRLYVES